MKNLTAVELLIEEISKHDKSFKEFYGSEIDKAKQLEKEQIIEAYNEGGISAIDDYNDTECGRESSALSAPDYYNETFKQTEL